MSSALLLALVAGCGGGDGPAAGKREPAAPPSVTPRATATPAPATVRRARCAADAGNCAAVAGRVLYVEAVDADGDGDAHYVLAGGHVTGPGLTVVDVERALRPRRLPRVGDLVSAAGPVFTGSYGQQQIQAVEVYYQPR